MEIIQNLASQQLSIYIDGDAMSLRDVILQAKESSKGFESLNKVMRCITANVDYVGSSASYHRPGYTWVREWGQARVFEVFNPTGKNNVEMPVLVYNYPKAPFMKAVSQVDWETLAGGLTDSVGKADNLGIGTPGSHWQSHEWYDGYKGVDAFRVYGRQIGPFQAYVHHGLTLYIIPSPYLYGDRGVYFGGAYADLTSYMPAASKCVRVIVYFDPADLTVKVASSAELPLDGHPAFEIAPKYTFPIVWVLLKDGDDSGADLPESRLYDARGLWSIKGDHHADHENGGDSEINVGGLSGVLADAQNADHIQGKDVPNPAAGDDGKAIVYDHASLAFILGTLVKEFTQLTDVPNSYAGHGGKVVKVKADASGLEFVAGGAGVTNFPDLGDVPPSYVGQGSKIPSVKVTEDGLEYITNAAVSIGQNFIINGGFRIAQRGVSFTSATTPANSDDTYLLDRWVLLSEGNDIVDVTQEASVVPTGLSHAIKLEVETANKQFGILYILENKDALALVGKAVSLSFKARMAAADDNTHSLKAVVLAWSSTADAVTSDVVDAWGATPTYVANWTAENVPDSNALTTSWQTFNINNISIDTASTTNVAVFIFCDQTDGVVDDAVYISAVKLEIGSSATDFIPAPIEDEISRCQRYFEKSFVMDTTPAYSVTVNRQMLACGSGGFSNSYCSFFFKTRKFKQPTMTYYNPHAASANWRWYKGAAGTDGTVTAEYIGTMCAVVRYTGDGAFTLVSGHWTADAEL